VFWQNRSYYIGVGGSGPGYTNQQNIVTLFNAFTSTAAPTQPQTDATTANGNGVVITGGTGACTAASYWDLGVRGDLGAGTHESGFTLAPTYTLLTNVSEAGTGTHDLTGSAANPTVISQYCNGSRTPPEFASMGWQTPPGISDATVPNPVFNLTPSATVDEGNNWINISWGPLALTNPVTGTVLGNYGPAAGSPVINYILSSAGAAYTNAPSLDFYGTPRKTNNAVDAGAVEYLVPAIAVASVTPTSVAFGNQTVNTTSAAHALTLSNTGGATLTGINVVVTTPFSRPTGTPGGTCGATLTAGATCTINVVFSPTSAVVSSGSVTITASVTVTGSAVTLSGTGVAATIAATLTPTTWSPTANRGIGILGPVQVFTLTNTGNVPLTGIAQGALGGASAADYTIVRALSTCGPTGGGQLVANVTLAPLATCAVTVRFQPTATETAGVKTATVSVTDLAGTQTSTLSGTVTLAALNLTPTGTTNFGTVAVAGTASATSTFTVTNPAGILSSPVPITFAFSGTNAGDFTRPAAGGTCGATVAGGANCTIIVRFKPLAPVAPAGRTATMTVPGATAVTLTGTAN
jgi:hypothetical protein